MKKFNLACLAVALCAGLAVYVVAAPPAGGYHLIKKVSFGAAEGGGEYFDYITVDSAARRVYLSHGTEFKVVDADNFSVVGTITGGFKRNHGLALVPELGKGFISDGRDNAVTIFDLKTLKTIEKVSISPATNPDAIMYEPSTKRVFTFNGRSQDSVVGNAEMPHGGANHPFVGGRNCPNIATSGL